MRPLAKTVWRHRRGDDEQAPITYTRHYTVVHRAEVIDGKLVPYFNIIHTADANRVIGRLPSLAKAKSEVERHRCEWARERRARAWDRWRERKMSAGVCVNCGAAPARVDRMACLPCAQQSTLRAKVGYRRRTGGKPNATRKCSGCSRVGHFFPMCPAGQFTRPDQEKP